MKAKVILWGLLLLALLSACLRPEEATPTPPTMLSSTPTATEAAPTLPPATPTATEEATSTPLPVTPTATKQATPTPPPATPTATTEPTPTPQPTSTPEGIWPQVVARLELGVPAGNGYYPRGIAVHSATGRVYVRNERGDSEEHGNVSIIYGTTNEIIATIPVGQGDWDYGEVAVDETTNRVYVVNRGDKTLTVIVGATHQTLATVEDVEAVAVDGARGHLYVADSEAVRLLDASDYSELRSASLVLTPNSTIRALVFNSPADRLYLARSSPNVLDILTASTLERVTSIPLKGPVQDLAVNTVANRLYVALSGGENDEILTLDGTSGDFITSLVAVGQYQINVLAVDERADRLYVGRAMWQEPGVLVVNGATGQIVDQIGPANSVEGIALDPRQKKLYLSLAYENQVAVVDTERKATVALVPTAIEAVDAAADPSAHRLYVTDSINQLHIFDSTDYEELALVSGGGPLAVDDVRHRVYVGDPDGRGVQIIDGRTNRPLGLIPQTGKPVVNPKTNELYIVESGIYIADPETQSVVDKIDSTFPEPHGFPPNPAAVDLAIDPQLNLLYGVISNGVPGSGGGSYLQVYDGVTHTSVFTDTELSVVSIDVDPTLGRAYVTRSRFNYSSLKVLAEGGRWVARLEGIVGNLRVDPNKGLVYLTSGWDKGHRLLIVDGQTADLLADVPLDGEYALRALDPLAEHLYLIGEGGSILVMADSGGAPPAPIEPQSVRLPVSAIQRIVVSPDYGRTPGQGDQTLFALVENKLYKSEDGGKSWVLISGGLPSQDMAAVAFSPNVVSIAFSPNYASDQTLLVGLSTWNIGRGVYKSTDGGRSWRLASRGLSDLRVQGVAFAADGTAFARTVHHGLFKRRPEPVEGSTDGGNLWTAIEEPQADRSINRHAIALAISPDYAADSTLFWSLDEMDRHVVLKSTDGGQSWEEVLDRTAQLLAISPDYVHDHTVYAVLSGAGLMRSTDGGETWQAANSGLFYKEMTLRDLALSPDFAEDKTLYALFSDQGTPPPYRSTDGGDNWKMLKEAISVSAFALAPDGDLLLGTVDGHIRSLRPDGLAWEDFRTGVDGMDIYDLAISPSYAQDQTIYASTSTVGVFVSHDGGHSWQETGFPGRAGGSTDYPRLAISPDYGRPPGQGDVHRLADGSLFAASGAGVYRFVVSEATATWEELQEGLGNLFPASALAISPNFPTDSTLFVGGDYRHPQVFISADRGESWTSESQGFPKAEIAILATSPNYAEDQTAYAWFQYQGLYRTVSGGLSWEQVTEEEDWYVQSMALSPDFAADQTLFVGAMYGNLHRSDDGGFTWQALGGGLPSDTVWVRALAISPEFTRDGTLFAGLDRGIHKSTDGGHSWQAVNNGLPHRADGELAGVLALAISPDYAADQTIFAALTEHGVYKSIDGGANWYPPTWGTPPPTPLPSPTPAAPTVTPTPLSSPSPTPTPCAVVPVRFAAIWADRRDRLGCPTEAEREVTLAEQAFERGRMFWRGDSGEIYVLHDDHTWRAFADTWQESQPQDDPNLTAPPDLFQPKRGFGKVWREKLGGPASQIGWAREEERGFTGVVQAFDGGTVLWSDLPSTSSGHRGTAYILYADGSWEQYGQR